MRFYWIGKIIVLFLLFFVALSAVTMVLWNWLLPELFDLQVITFWQAGGILLLSRIIFGFGRSGRRSGEHWKNHWAAKWRHLPEEQREKWRQKFEEKWSCNLRKSDDNPVEQKAD